MLTNHSTRPTTTNAHVYSYIAGLLSGIGLTFLGAALLAILRSDHMQFHLFMGLVGLLFVMMGLLPLLVFYRIWRRLPAGRRDGSSRFTWLRTPWTMLSLSLICIGIGFFSQNILALLLGASSFVPDIIGWLFIASGLALSMMLLKRLALLHEGVQYPQTASDQNAPAEE